MRYEYDDCMLYEEDGGTGAEPGSREGGWLFLSMCVYVWLNG